MNAWPDPFMIQPYTTLNDPNPLSDLIALIERHAPRYMRGDRAAPVHERVPLTDETREAIRARWRVLGGTGEPGEQVRRIAAAFHVDESTVRRITRDLRGTPARAPRG